MKSKLIQYLISCLDVKEINSLPADKAQIYEYEISSIVLMSYNKCIVAVESKQVKNVKIATLKFQGNRTHVPLLAVFLQHNFFKHQVPTEHTFNVLA